MQFFRLMKFSLFAWGVVLLMLALLLPACATFRTEVAPKIASGVKHYCAEPFETRTLIRAQVNELLGGAATIQVTCEGDPS